MKRHLAVILMLALALCSCQTPDDPASSQAEVSTESSEPSDIPTESEDPSSDTSSALPVPDDEPFVELTALTEDEIAALNLPEGYYSADESVRDEFFTKELTAVSYAESVKGGDLTVLISRDGGVTWEETVISDRYCHANYIGFTSEKNGWLFVAGDRGTGRQYLYVFVTHDGGKSWEEVSNPYSEWSYGIRDALFISRNIGLICYEYREERQPVIYRTDDGGRSWKRQVLSLSDITDGDARYAEVTEAVYEDGVVTLTVEVYGDSDSYYLTYTSSDMGLTFERAKG